MSRKNPFVNALTDPNSLGQDRTNADIHQALSFLERSFLTPDSPLRFRFILDQGAQLTEKLMSAVSVNLILPPETRPRWSTGTSRVCSMRRASVTQYFGMSPVGRAHITKTHSLAPRAGIFSI